MTFLLPPVEPQRANPPANENTPPDENKPPPAQHVPLDERARLRRKRARRAARAAAAAYCSPQRQPLSPINLAWLAGCPLESEAEGVPGAGDGGPALPARSLAREDLTAAAAALDALVNKEAECHDGCVERRVSR